MTGAADNQAVGDAADVVLVAVLPDQAEAVLTALEFGERHTIVSLVAGVSIEDLVAWSGVARVARSVPLPAVARREGRTPVYPPLPEAVALYGRLGGAIAVDDVATYEALTAASATVAAHFSYLGAITDWLVAKGLSAADARDYVAVTFIGASESLQAGTAFDELIAEVATPGGLNEQFARHLRDAGAVTAVGTGLDAVFARLAES